MKYSIATITLLSASVLAYVPNPHYKRNIGADVATPCDKDNSIPAETTYLPPAADLDINYSQPLDIPAGDEELESGEPEYDSDVQLDPESEVPAYDSDVQVDPESEAPTYDSDVQVEPLESACSNSENDAPHQAEVGPIETATFDVTDHAYSTETPEMEAPQVYDSIPEDIPTDSQPSSVYDTMPIETPTYSEEPVVYESEVPTYDSDVQLDPEIEVPTYDSDVQVEPESEVPAYDSDVQVDPEIEAPTYDSDVQVEPLESPCSNSENDAPHQAEVGPIETATFDVTDHAYSTETPEMEAPQVYDSIPEDIPTDSQPSSVYDTMPIETPTYSEEPVVYESSLPYETPTDLEAPLPEYSSETIPEYDSPITMSGSRTNTASIVFGLLMLSFFS